MSASYPDEPRLAGSFPALVPTFARGRIDPRCEVPPDLTGPLSRPNWRAVVEYLAETRLGGDEVRKLARMATPAGGPRWMVLRLLPLAVIAEPRQHERVNLLDEVLLLEEVWASLRWTLPETARISRLLTDVRRRSRIAFELLCDPWNARPLADDLNDLDADGLAVAAERITTGGATRTTAITGVTGEVWTERHASAPNDPRLVDLHGTTAGGYQLVVPRTAGEVAAWGRRLGTCLRSHYPRRVVTGQTSIVGIHPHAFDVERDAPSLVVELEPDRDEEDCPAGGARRGRVVAMLGAANRLPSVVEEDAAWAVLLAADLLSSAAQRHLPPPKTRAQLRTLLDEVSHVDRFAEAARTGGQLLWRAGHLPNPWPAAPAHLLALRRSGPVTPPYLPHSGNDEHPVGAQLALLAIAGQHEETRGS